VDGGDRTGSHGATAGNEKGNSCCVSTEMSMRRQGTQKIYHRADA
jgi:hypothetical protein